MDYEESSGGLGLSRRGFLGAAAGSLILTVPAISLVSAAPTADATSPIAFIKVAANEGPAQPSIRMADHGAGTLGSIHQQEVLAAAVMSIWRACGTNATMIMPIALDQGASVRDSPIDRWDPHVDVFPVNVELTGDDHRQCFLDALSDLQICGQDPGAKAGPGLA